MAVGDAYVFPGFLIPVLTQLFFPKPPTTFLTCFCRGERRKYAGKKSRLNLESNSQPPGHESDMLTTEPPGQGPAFLEKALIHYEKIIIPYGNPSVIKLLFSFLHACLTALLTHYQTTNFSLFQTERVCRRQFQIL